MFVCLYSASLNHKVGGYDNTQQLGHMKPEFHQSYQQRTNNQLQAINEILMKSKSSINSLQKNQENMKVFPEDPPPQAKPMPSNSASDKKSLKIQLNRLHPEHIEQMGKYGDADTYDSESASYYVAIDLILLCYLLRR